MLQKGFSFNHTFQIRYRPSLNLDPHSKPLTSSKLTFNYGHDVLNKTHL